MQGSRYARYLAELGHEVTYLTSSYPGAPQRERRDGVDIVRLGRPELLGVRAWSYYRRFGDEFDVVYTEAFGGARIPFLLPLYVQQPALVAWYQVNQPIFAHQYGRAAGAILGRLEKFVARIHRGATILTPSDARRKDVLALGFRADQVVAIPPVAVEDALSQCPNTPDEEPLVVWLGKLRRYKCPHHIVEAMPAVRKVCPDARLVIAGRRDEESYLREIRAEIERRGLSGVVEFAFDLTEEAKRDLLRRARVLVVPSPIEGFGIVILEAAAQGTPVIASEGVPEEVVTHDVNGLRVPFGDIPRISDAISQVLASPALHARLARNAIAHAEGFTKAALQRKLERVLHRAVGAPTNSEAVV